MDEPKNKKESKIIYRKQFEKIYSRWCIRLPKIKESFAISKNDNHFKENYDKGYQHRFKKVIQIMIILLIAFLIVNVVMQAVEPIIDAQCVSMAKSVATKISNEQATIVMANYDYDDLMKVIKDENGNVKLASANMITINQIISDIPILIQNELEKVETELIAIKSYIETQDYEESISELDKSVFVLKHIEDKYAFNLQNVF